MGAGTKSEPGVIGRGSGFSPATVAASDGPSGQDTLTTTHSSGRFTNVKVAVITDFLRTRFEGNGDEGN